MNEIGEITRLCWFEIIKHFPRVELDEFIVMPNHIHGIMKIYNDFSNTVGAQNFVPLHQKHRFQHVLPRSLASIVRGYKIGVTKMAKQINSNYPIWQRGYYERVIRDEKELNAIRQYIIDNPLNWRKDDLTKI